MRVRSGWWQDGKSLVIVVLLGFGEVFALLAWLAKDTGLDRPRGRYRASASDYWGIDMFLVLFGTVFGSPHTAITRSPLTVLKFAATILLLATVAVSVPQLAGVARGLTIIIIGVPLALSFLPLGLAGRWMSSIWLAPWRWLWSGTKRAVGHGLSLRAQGSTVVFEVHTGVGPSVVRLVGAASKSHVVAAGDHVRVAGLRLPRSVLALRVQNTRTGLTVYSDHAKCAPLALLLILFAMSLFSI